jgi:hypothetical protein
VKFEQLGEAIAALGTSLGQSLGQTLKCWDTNTCTPVSVVNQIVNL